jgi:hypothetical protein
LTRQLATEYDATTHLPFTAIYTQWGSLSYKEANQRRTQQASNSHNLAAKASSISTSMGILKHATESTNFMSTILRTLVFAQLVKKLTAF